MNNPNEKHKNEDNYELLYKIFNQMKVILEPNHNQTSKDVCKYHQQGRCRFGKNCKNIHITPSSTLERPATPDNSQRL